MEAVHLEATVQSFNTIKRRLIARSYEKALRSAEDHPKRLALEEYQPVVKKRTNWRQTVTEIAASLPPELENRLPLTPFAIAPWKAVDDPNWIVFDTVPGITSRKDDADAMLAASLRQISSFDADITIYTDGSCDAGLYDGGAAAIITTGPPEEPDVLHEISKLGSRYTYSYNEEHAALDAVIDWIEKNENYDATRILIVTDSQSLCKTLQSPTSAITTTIDSLNNLIAEVIIQWVPGHCKIPGNEMADKKAKEATIAREDEQRPPTTIEAAWTTIKRIIKDDQPQHPRIAATYAGRSRKRDKEEITNRSDQVLLARLRTGHHYAFWKYLNRLDPSIHPKCPLCKEDEHSLEHWIIDCPGISQERMNLFGTHRGQLSWLSSHPLKSVALAKMTLLGESP